MKAYLIPGWGEDLKDRNYQLVLDVYNRAGYQPEFLPINWNRRTIEDWVEEVKIKLSKHDIRDSLLSGFSFGAVTALSVAGTYQSPERLMLFSLSSYYNGDNPKPSWLKDIGKKRTVSFSAIDFQKLAANIKSPTNIFCGSKEGPEMLHRAGQANKAIRSSKLFIVDGVSHDVTDPEYIKAIETALISK
jgi:pimeloyl-ACP methyl ester carboxylesterase